MRHHRTKLYFTLTPAPNPFAPNANPRFFGKVIPVPPERAYSPPHPVRTDEVDGERRVNRTAGGLGHVSRAPNLCPVGITAGFPRLAAWVLPPRAPRRSRLILKYQRRKRLGARPPPPQPEAPQPMDALPCPLFTLFDPTVPR